MLYSDEDIQSVFERLWSCSGFPEPFLRGNETYYKRWRRPHIDVILRQDLIDLSSVRDISGIETLVMLLKERVGSSVSYANLGRDLDRDANTVKRWLALLEKLYIIYRAKPYHKNIARSLLKAPKFYFYDHSLIDNNGARLENIVSNALKKELQYLEDTKGLMTSLHYLRTKDGKEIDFLITIDGKPTHVIEIKTSNADPSPAFEYFRQFLPNTRQLQLVKNLTREKTYPHGLELRGLINWLANFQLDE
jgi:predicted AAA+ superfamily ATPase